MSSFFLVVVVGTVVFAGAGGGPWPRHIIDGCLFSRVSGVSPRFVACDRCSLVVSSLFATDGRASFVMVNDSPSERWGWSADKDVARNVGSYASYQRVKGDFIITTVGILQDVLFQAAVST
jgi:hypothetical protein